MSFPMSVENEKEEEEEKWKKETWTVHFVL